jgi:hypothetical protein
MQTLLNKAATLVRQDVNRSPQFETLTDIQREELASLAIQEYGDHKEEVIEDVFLNESLINKLLEALQEKNIADRNILLKEIGEMLLKGAIEGCKNPINDALNEAFTALAVKRQFWNDMREMQLIIELDNKERARDMRLAARGY